MNPLIVIPARMASTRLPGKPLADIGGTPMIVRVWRQAMAAAIGPVVVAAAEREIAAAVSQAGGRCVLTAPDLASGTDRVHAAVGALDPEGHHDVVINLQGDLPAIDPAQIRAVLEPLAPTGADIATLAAEIEDEVPAHLSTDGRGLDDPNRVTVTAQREVCAPTIVREPDDGYRRSVAGVEQVARAGLRLDDPLSGLALRAEEHVGGVLMLSRRQKRGCERRDVTHA